MRQLSRSQARRLAIGGQGLLEHRPPGTPNRGHLKRAIGHLGVLQIDAVNSIARSHHLVLRARMGAYDESLLDRAQRAGDLVEYWAHEACFLPPEDHPLFRWRMARAERGELWKGIVRFVEEKGDYVDQVLSEVEAHGPLKASDISEGTERTGEWWGWADSKTALEWLFWIGRITVARREGFTRYYDLTERVLAPEIVNAPTPTEEAAHRELLRRAADRLGVGTAADLGDYNRLPKKLIKARVAELVEAGDLVPTRVEGWTDEAYTPAELTIPRRTCRSTLLSPFDPIAWFRPRGVRMFDFEYKLEIYTPAAKRRYGYYVLPFLHDNDLVGRVDLRADRDRSTLQVLGSFAEPGPHHPLHGDPRLAGETIEALTEELRDLARWRDLEHIEVTSKGELAPELLAHAPDFIKA